VEARSSSLRRLPCLIAEAIFLVQRLRAALFAANRCFFPNVFDFTASIAAASTYVLQLHFSLFFFLPAQGRMIFEAGRFQRKNVSRDLSLAFHCFHFF
jgi:hypothetical protein